MCLVECIIVMSFSFYIQGVSRLEDITAAGDILGLNDKKR